MDESFWTKVTWTKVTWIVGQLAHKEVAIRDSDQRCEVLQAKVTPSLTLSLSHTLSRTLTQSFLHSDTVFFTLELREYVMLTSSIVKFRGSFRRKPTLEIGTRRSERRGPAGHPFEARNGNILKVGKLNL